MEKEQFLELSRRISTGYNQLGMYYFHSARNMVMKGNRTTLELRQYGRDEQPVAKYEHFFRKDPKNPNKLLIKNVSKDTAKIAGKIKNAYTSTVGKYEYRFDAKATSRKARAEKELMAMTMKFEALPFVKEIRAMMGISSPADNLNPEDVDFLVGLNALKTDIEISLKDAITDVHRTEDIDTLKTLWLSDIADFKCMAAHIFFCQRTKRVKVEYVRPDDVIIERSDYPDHRDCRGRGLWREGDIIDIANQAEIDPAMIPSSFTRDGVAGLKKVRYITYYFVATDVETFITGTHKKGNSEFRSVANDFKLTEKMAAEGKSIVKYETEYVYKMSFIPGTGIVWDYGKDNYNVREGSEGDMKAQIPLIFHSISGASAIEKIIDLVDEFQIMTLKVRNFIANIPPQPEKLIDLALLRDVINLGGEKYSLKDILEVSVSNGLTVYESINEHGEPGGSQRPPVSTVFNPYADELMRYKNVLIATIQEIKDRVGINDMIDSSNPTPEMLVGVAGAMQEGATAVMKPETVAYRMFYENVLNMVSLKYQVAVLEGDIEGEYFDGSTVKIYRLSKEILSECLRIHVTASPISNTREILLQQLLQFKDSVPPETYIFVFQTIMRGDYEQAHLYLTRAISKAKEEAHRMNVEVQQAQGQANAQAAAAQEEQKRQTMQLDYKLKADLMRLEAELKKGNISHQSEQDIQRDAQSQASNLMSNLISGNEQGLQAGGFAGQG